MQFVMKVGAALPVFLEPVQCLQHILANRGFQNVRDDTWEQILTRIERERALVRARASHPSQ